MKIVVVEDEPSLSDALKDKLTRSGFDVSVVRNGDEAIETIRKVKPDIVSLDLLLPKKNGYKVLEELKEDVELKLIPVVVMSNLGEDEDIKKCLKLGAEDYFVKSQHPIGEIVEKLKSVVLQKSR